MKQHCCIQMTKMVHYQCKQHISPFECPDHLIYYNSRFDEYGIIVHDGGSSTVLIHFCPWCGTRLPESKRDRWFQELERLGFDDPTEKNIPSEFLTDEWYKNR